MKLFKGKKAVAVAASAGLVLGIAGGAFAYFTAANGTASGSATVGTSTAWSVANDGTTGGPLYPGSGTETVAYTVTNPSDGHQLLSSVSVTVDADSNGDVISTASGNPSITGCQASWFTVTDNDGALPLDLAGSATFSADSDIVLDNVNANQDACKNAAFKVTITAAS
jgi:hypothetical protein